MYPSLRSPCLAHAFQRVFPHKPPKNTDSEKTIRAFFPKILENKSRFWTKSQKNAFSYELTPENSAKQGFSMNSSEKGQSFQKYLENFFGESQVTPAKRSFVFVAGARPHQKHCVYRDFVPHQTKTRKKCRSSQVLGFSGVKKYQK